MPAETLYEGRPAGRGPLRLELWPGAGLVLRESGAVVWRERPAGEASEGFRGWFDGASGAEPDPGPEPGGYMDAYRRGRG